MLVRLGALAAAVLVSLVFFKGMHSMIGQSNQTAVKQTDPAVIDFVRYKRDSEAKQKTRQKKEPPKPKKPRIPQQSMEASSSAVSVAMTPFTSPVVEASYSVGRSNLMADAKVGFGFGDNDALPLVKVRPIYPQRARSRKITGFVKARLELTEEGTVSNVSIIEAKPKGVFERSAVRALYQYKFKPKLIDGKAQTQVVTQTIIYGLKNK